VQKKIKAFLERFPGLMSFQHFSRQARGDPSRTQEEEVSIWKKSMYSTMEGTSLFISISIRKLPPGESVLPPLFCPFCCL
jgi:hypothetical protein